MRRISLFLDEKQIENLGKLPGTLSEHTRRAINDYLKNNYPQPITSPSVKFKNIKDTHKKE